MDAASAAAISSFEDHGVAPCCDEVFDLGAALQGFLGTGNGGNADAERRLAGADLVAQKVDDLGPGANPVQPGVDDLLGEGGVLCQESVAGVDCVRAGSPCDLKDFVAVQVGVGGGGAAQGVGLIRCADKLGIHVLISVNSNGRAAAFLDRTNDAQGNLAAVCDQNLRGCLCGH